MARDWNKVGAIAGIVGAVFTAAGVVLVIWQIRLQLQTQPQQSVSASIGFDMSRWGPTVVLVTGLLLTAGIQLWAILKRRIERKHELTVQCADKWLHDIAEDEAKTIYRFVQLTRCLIGRHELRRPDPYLEFQMIVDN